MMNVIVLIGIIFVGIVGLVALGVVIWLVARPEPSAQGRTSERRAPDTEAPPPEPEAVAADLGVTEDEGGPHPRPRELDRESRRELLLLEERLHRTFFDRSEMSPAEWARIADDLLIVHDRMPVGILVEHFERVTGTAVSAPSQTDKSAREVAALLNQQLNEDRRLVLLRTLDDPIEADVYGPQGSRE